MNLTDIPFVAQVGIDRGEGDALRLPFGTPVTNHLATVHAGAQFTLAETASADCLQKTFPELVAQVVPVLRGCQVKFKAPAGTELQASATNPDAARQRFLAMLERKGRGTISVDVEIRDAEQQLTGQAVCDWLVQKR